LFAWNQVSEFSTVILVEGLFDLASLWQAGFRNTTSSVGTHQTPAQWAKLCDSTSRQVYIVFDQDENQAGQNASCALALRLQNAGLAARIVQLPATHDPNSFFCGGATAADFTRCLEQAR
jgi:DNA primase